MSDYRARLIRFYKQWNPEKASAENVDSTLAKFAGREEEMFRALVNKYGPEPPAPAAPAPKKAAKPAKSKAWDPFAEQAFVG